MKRGRLYIGTSGWVYGHWKRIFYPDDLSTSKWLEFYTEHFKTAEINNSFYHLPTHKTFKNWKLRTPDNFVFSVKVSRYITHVKRLKNVKSSWNLFLKRALGLGEKLGPLLLQFPASFVRNDETFNRLRVFLEYASENGRLSFEFRHQSWDDKEVLELLKKFGAANVIASSSVHPKIDSIISNFVYIRMHGPKGLFNSNYSLAQIRELAELIEKAVSRGIDAYVYFNNDADGFAVKNGKELMSVVGNYVAI